VATSPIRLLIVDDDPLVLSSLRLYFGAPAAESIEVVGEAATAQDALDILEAASPEKRIDVVMADIHMPGMDGVELLGKIRQIENPPDFVAMTALDEEDTMLSILAQGGRGYILKSSRPEFIIDTVLAAVGGGTVVSPQPASRLVQHLSTLTESSSDDATGEATRPDEPVTEVIPGNPARNLPRLSASEERVLGLVCDGLSNAEISKKTGRSASAIKKQISNLLVKFGAGTRVQLAVLAVEAGFVPDDSH
jgi:DNA-binding NarL/FixJ family response regulator